MPRQYGYPRGTFIGADEDTMGDEEVDSPFQFTQYEKKRQTPGFRQGRTPRARSRYTGMQPRQQEVQGVAPSAVSVATGPTQTETDALIKKYRDDMKEANITAQKTKRDMGPDTIGAPTGMSVAQSGAQGIIGSPFGVGTATDIALSAANMANMGVTGANIAVGGVLGAVPLGVLSAIQHGRQVAAVQGQVSAEALSDPAAIAAVQGQTGVAGLTSAQQAHVMDIQMGKQQAQATTGIKGTLSSIAKGLQLDDLAEMLGITSGKGATSVTADDLATQTSPKSLVADPITRGFSSADENFAMNLELEELGLLDLDLGAADPSDPSVANAIAQAQGLADLDGEGPGGLGEGPGGAGIGDSSW